ncbi:MAG TPA: ABC transporter substrate-binding protein [Mycobacteriales bacterium]|jgi:peptide/nickel transport system substrate-binding protein|nr:ABC transporter substrate-binding protein [Mycobacteriales bacterium]
MSLRKHTRVGAALFCALALTAAACGTKDKTGDGGGDLKPGGVLKLSGLKDVTHYDTNQAYEVRAWGFHLRATTRQMLSYANTKDEKKRDEPVPDLATDMPKISDDGLTYTYTIKDNVKFSTGKEIEAADFIRAIKRLCDPNGVSGGLSYYTATITGMTSYCDGFAGIKKDDPKAAKAYVEGHEISGLTAPSPKTLVVKLTQKAGDFNNMMAIPFTTPVPPEVLNYLTDSAEFRKHLGEFASGPYMVDTYAAKQSLTLKRNPQWVKDTDKLRAAYVDRVEITLNAASKEAIQQQVEAGTVDMYLRGNPPNAAAAKAEAANDPRLKVDKDGACVFYISFNLNHSTPGGQALKNKVVRQALNYAIDKTAIIQVLGGPRNGSPAGQILTPVLLGYKQIDPYATPNSKGDLAKAKSLLQSANITSLKLDFIYDNTETNKNIVQVVADQLKNIGIAINPIPRDDATVDTTNPKSDNWDLYYAGWCPDWNGNGARTFFTPLLSDPGLKNYKAGGSYNYGGYDNPDVDKKVEEALAATPEQAADIWPEIDAKVMDDAPWIPIYTSNSVNFISSRVKGFVFFPFSTSGDITNIAVS